MMAWALADDPDVACLGALFSLNDPEFYFGALVEERTTQVVGVDEDVFAPSVG
jgi:hypothetical protein